MTFSIEGKTPLQFWEGLYANASGETSRFGSPNKAGRFWALTLLLLP